jgi:hypothetical protein
MPSDDIMVSDRTVVRFLVNGRAITVAIRDGGLRVEAERPIIIEPVASNNVRIVIDRR